MYELNFTLEEALNYLENNRPTEKVENVFRDMDPNDILNNPIYDMMRNNIFMHNNLVDREYDTGMIDLGLHSEFIVNWMIDGVIRDDPEYYLDPTTTHVYKIETRPVMEAMQHSDEIRKIVLDESKRNLIYNAMDRALAMSADNMYSGFAAEEAVEPLLLALKIGHAIKEEYGR